MQLHVLELLLQLVHRELQEAPSLSCPFAHLLVPVFNVVSNLHLQPTDAKPAPIFHYVHQLFLNIVKDKPEILYELQNEPEISTGLGILQLNTAYFLFSVIILSTCWHTGQKTWLSM